MKRFHVHARVADLARSIDFYSKLFGAPPARVESDYAKWMLDDPRLNFAISTRGSRPGIDHLGIQAETDDELAFLKRQAGDADASIFDEGATSCCYALSDKHWVTDPQGIAWEQFRNLGAIRVYAEPAPASEAACCGPTSKSISGGSCC